jgi:hypothetical protein
MRQGLSLEGLLDTQEAYDCFLERGCLRFVYILLFMVRVSLSRALCVNEEAQRIMSMKMEGTGKTIELIAYFSCKDQVPLSITKVERSKAPSANQITLSYARFPIRSSTAGQHHFIA